MAAALKACDLSGWQVVVADLAGDGARLAEGSAVVCRHAVSRHVCVSALILVRRARKARGAAGRRDVMAACLCYRVGRCTLLAVV